MVYQTRTGGRGRRLRAAGLATAALLTLATPTRSIPSRAADLEAGAAPATHLAIGTMTVEVQDGTPGLERLLQWSFAQFDARTLGTPRVARVAFRPRDSCTGVTGWISGGDVTLCFVQEEACVDATCTAWRPWAKRTAMHELAHAWLAEHLTEDRIRDFLAITGLPTWAGDTHPWRERGVELAAETMAWASLDPPARVNAQLGNPSCPDLARYYQALTGRPIRPEPACARSDPPTGPSVSTRHGWVHSPDPTEPGRCGAAVSDIAGGECSAQVRRSAAQAERTALLAADADGNSLHRSPVVAPASLPSGPPTAGSRSLD